MKKYFDFNTKTRTNAANNFEKYFLNWQLIVSVAKEWKTYEKEQSSKKCQVSKKRKRFFKMHQHTNSY